MREREIEAGRHIYIKRERDRKRQRHREGQRKIGIETESDRERKEEQLNEYAHWVIACFLLANSFGRELPFPLQQ